MHDIDKSMLLKMLNVMVETEQTDKVYSQLPLFKETGAYMPSTGEEGVQVGCAAALHSEDWLYLQYRELGMLLYRGYSQFHLANQLFGTQSDIGKARQMPGDYCDPAINAQPTSAPLSTQIPQAAGLGYALRMQGKRNVCVGAVGEGAASMGDVHAGMNIAMTRKAQTLFLCRNNGFARATRVEEQYAGQGVAERGVGYGMPAIRVDGNDPLAVYFATKAARDHILSNCTPVLLEAMTYRRGPHSSADDPTRYRSNSEVKHFEEVDNPILRFWKFLNNHGLETGSLENLRHEAAEKVQKARELAKNTPPPSWESMFEDVYDQPSEEIKAQKAEFTAHYLKYKDYYDSKVLH
jgi:2-oxoisovalerate dehydrogenase E1 component alpha subunit